MVIFPLHQPNHRSQGFFPLDKRRERRSPKNEVDINPVPRASSLYGQGEKKPWGRGSENFRFKNERYPRHEVAITLAREDGA